MQMAAQGWRAIIYDADWARFKTGQTGVFVSDDGKTCETIDDDKSNIVVVADPNISFDRRTNGHILFRQKGSDLYDIVCLGQDPGGTYGLEISNKITIDGCVGMTYGEFVRKLIVYETINGIKYQINDYSVVQPTASDFSINGNYVQAQPGDDYSIVVEKSGFTASSTFKVTAVDDVYYEYTNTTIEINGEPTIEPSEDGEKDCHIGVKVDSANGCDGGIVIFARKYIGEVTCSLYLGSGNVAGRCEGGKVIFGVNETQVSNPYYIITIPKISITDYYDEIQCGTVIDNIEEPCDGAKINVLNTENGDITVIDQNTDGEGETVIKISVVDGISSVSIKISPDCGDAENRSDYKTITLQIPS